MRAILHIQIQPDDGLAQKVIQLQSQAPAIIVETVDLSAAQPDYDLLVEKIFSADSVQVW